MTDKRIMYLDGQFLSEDKAVVPITTHALHYGTGVFEGIRAYYNDQEKALFAFRVEDHFKRLVDSCKIVCIDLNLSPQELTTITIELIKKNFSESDMYIRPLAFKSDPAVGNFNLKSLKSSLAIYTVMMGRMIEKEGIKANISSWTRVPDNSIPPRAKITGAYMNTCLAKTESILGGYDEALLMDNRGHVVEGSAENIFLVKNGKVYTPSASEDILVGITRDTVCKLLQNQLKLSVIERSLDRSEIYQADEIFLVGTGAEVTPVIDVEGRIIGNGDVGPVSKEIKELYRSLVHGQTKLYPEFLTKIILPT